MESPSQEPLPHSTTFPPLPDEFLETRGCPCPRHSPSRGIFLKSRVAPNENLLATYTSPPLGQDLTVINKVSQNLHVELVLRDLGKAVLNDGSMAAGVRVVRQFLGQRRMSPQPTSSSSTAPASRRKTLLRRERQPHSSVYIARQPWGEAFRQTLPIAGVDGSLSGRFTQSPVKGKFFAKTGTLSEVNALSGYLTTRSGKTVILSILCNDHDPSSEATRKAADKIVEAIYCR